VLFEHSHTLLSRGIRSLMILNCYILLTVLLQAQNVINEVHFTGNLKFTQDQCLEWSEIRSGNFFDNKVIEHANKKIIQNMRNRGYLYARIDTVSIKRTNSGNSYNLTWFINENFPFQIKTISIKSDSIAADDIFSKMNIKEGDIFSRILLEEDFIYISSYFASIGYPFVNLSVDDIVVKKSDENYYDVDISINAHAGKLTNVYRIILRGNKITKDDVILREIGLEPGALYNQEEIDNIPQILNRLGYFKQVEQPKLILTENKKIALMIEVEEGNTTTFDGVVGYMPDDPSTEKSEGYFTGLLNASMRNLFGTGRKFEIFWEKPDKYSDQFKLYYEEPWIFNLPVNIGAGLERLVRDTTYIERTYFINSSFKLSSTMKATLTFSQKSTVPDSLASRTLRLARNITTSAEVGIEYDTRDYPINPRNGILYTTYYSFGQKLNTGPSYLLSEDKISKNEEIQKVQVGLKYFQPLWQNQVLAFSFNGARIRSNKDRLQLTDHIWFGGARSLRGYRENQFHGSVVSWLNLEYRFLISRNSRLFMFNDWGFFNYSQNNKTKEDIMPGYGVGIRFDTALGIMGVDYGLGRGDSFSNGKIHFGIENSF